MATSEMAMMLLVAAAGAVAASVLSLVPALHIYNVAGFIILATGTLGEFVPPELLAMFFLGLITGYAMLNTIPSIFLSAPDDSTVFVVLPGQKYLLQQRGYEAVVLTGLGGLGGIAVLALLTLVASTLFPAVRAILQPHLHWILWTVIAYMLISEWPKGSDRAPAGFRRWWDGWKSLTAGLITFLLSGLLGFVLLYRSLVPVTIAYQNFRLLSVSLPCRGFCRTSSRGSSCRSSILPRAWTRRRGWFFAGRSQGRWVGSFPLSSPS